MTTDAARLGIYMLDVGQGDCTFIVPPQGEGDAILLDCNDAYVAERFVSNHGIRRLRAVVASHLDRDHIRGIVPFLETYFSNGNSIDMLFVGVDRPPGEPGKAVEVARLLERALAWAEDPPCPGFILSDPTRVAAPVVLASGSGWQIELVLPFYTSRVRATGIGGEDPNRSSVVLRVSRQGSNVLIGGDASLDSWERLEPALLPAAAIRTSHHGGDLGSGARWSEVADLYQAVNADHAFISVGTNNAYEHPNAAHVAAMRNGGRCRVRCTQLTTRCHPSPETLRNESLDIAGAIEWPYRHRTKPGDPRRTNRTHETPCAGSMVVWIDAAGSISAEPRPRGDHDLFLAKVRRPLCVHT